MEGERISRKAETTLGSASLAACATPGSAPPWSHAGGNDMVKRVMGRFSVNLGVLAAAIALFAQGPEPSGVTIRTTTTLVQVGVVVRDAKGRPVEGLRKEDFEILDNGKPQPIAVFYGVEIGDRKSVVQGK